MNILRYYVYKNGRKCLVLFSVLHSVISLLSRCKAKSILLFSRSTKPKACVGVCKAYLRVISSGNTAPFEVMSQRWRAVGNTVYNLTGPRFESRASHFRDEQQKRFLITCTCTDCSCYTEFRKLYCFFCFVLKFYFLQII